MLCKKCGAESSGLGAFCAKCGAPLAEGPVTVVSGTPVVSGELKWGIFVGTLFLPILGIIMGLVYVSDPREPRKIAGRLWVLTGCIAAVLYMMMIAR